MPVPLWTKMSANIEEEKGGKGLNWGEEGSQMGHEGRDDRREVRVRNSQVATGNNGNSGGIKKWEGVLAHETIRDFLVEQRNTKNH